MFLYDWKATDQPVPPVEIATSPTALTDPAAIVGMARTLYNKWIAERDRLELIEFWLKGTQDPFDKPGCVDREVKKLTELGRTPWLGLVVTTIAQAMFVDGFRSPTGQQSTDGPWKTWNGNRFASRQVAIHRAALGYGYAYVLVETGNLNGVTRAVMRGMSPKRMFAQYADPSFDEWPEYALRVDTAGDKSETVYLYDDEFEHKLTFRSSSDRPWTLLSTRTHGAGVVPVVRYTNQLDLDGYTPGEVEPYIEVAERIDKSVFDRLQTQHVNSWKKMWIAGLTDQPPTEEAARQAKIKLRQDDILVAESAETKFGTIDETDLGGFIDSINSDIEHLAAVAQLPSHLLTGKVINLSSDALSAARAPLTQKVYERQVSFGQSHSQALRLAALLEGDLDAANDPMSHVTWQDMEVRSLAQAADALGKLAEMLGVPRAALWRMIPNVDEITVQEWEEHALADDKLTTYLRELTDKKQERANIPGPAGAAAPQEEVID